MQIIQITKIVSKIHNKAITKQNQQTTYCSDHNPCYSAKSLVSQKIDTVVKAKCLKTSCRDVYTPPLEFLSEHLNTDIKSKINFIQDETFSWQIFVLKQKTNRRQSCQYQHILRQKHSCSENTSDAIEPLMYVNKGRMVNRHYSEFKYRVNNEERLYINFVT